MKILFIHRNFPAQFKFLATELAKNPENEVVFLTNNINTKTFSGIKKIIYKLKRSVSNNCHKYLRSYEEAVNHGQAVAEALIALKQAGYKPDIIYGHTWGQTLFVKEIYPEVPLICYFEWFYNPFGADVGFNGKPVGIDEQAKLKCRNTYILQDLVSCDYGISPTEWQKSQFPKIFHDKISVLHEGIDTEICKPNDKAEFYIKDKKLYLTKNAEILTYATRGMEEYRGFPEFMKAASILQKKRPNLHVIVAGEDRVCYGRKIKNTTFKQLALKELEFDMSRLHFVGNLPYDEYVKLLQVSTAHVYLTYPFVLSWSLLEAMSTGCCIIASNTPPVKEVIKDGENGILTDFYDIDSLVEKINSVLDNRENYKNLCNSARETIIKRYDKKLLLPKHIELLENIIKTSNY